MPQSETPETILIVDDQPSNLNLLSQILQDNGYHLRAVTSGARALASVELQVPDLILLDIRMPGMDGYQVCQELKANPRTEDVPVIFISALDDVDDKVKAFAAGGVDYVTKPFQLEEVTARVRTHLALRRLQKSLQDANQRMQRELTLAAQVQASFLPRSLPELDGWQLSVSLLPAKMTSGDFFDVLSLPDGQIGLMIADVVDKGVGAALFMAMCCALLRTHAAEHADQPDEVFRLVNQSILEYTSADQFVTVFLAILDPASGRIRYANAGHNPPLWLRPSQGEPPQLLYKTGPPVGILETATWEQGTVQPALGDALVLYTDGITDAENTEREFFDLDRLLEIAGQNAGMPASTMRDAILANVRQFTNGTTLRDDIALMVLARR